MTKTQIYRKLKSLWPEATDIVRTDFGGWLVGIYKTNENGEYMIIEHEYDVEENGLVLVSSYQSAA